MTASRFIEIDCQPALAAVRACKTTSRPADDFEDDRVHRVGRVVLAAAELVDVRAGPRPQQGLQRAQVAPFELDGQRRAEQLGVGAAALVAGDQRNWL
jgi:hypothetical protein